MGGHINKPAAKKMLSNVLWLKEFWWPKFVKCRQPENGLGSGALTKGGAVGPVTSIGSSFPNHSNHLGPDQPGKSFSLPPALTFFKKKKKSFKDMSLLQAGAGNELHQGPGQVAGECAC